MRATFVTLFPEMILPVVQASILGRAGRPDDQGAVTLDVDCVQLRGFSTNKHRTVDESPAGGGAGMVLRVDVVAPAVRHALARAPTVDPRRARVVFFDARGEVFDQHRARAFAAGVDHLVLVCGRYEGFDHRALVADYGVAVDVVSLGDFVLTGGELPALVVVDAVTRLLPGVLGNACSAVHESHGDDRLLEHRQYTRPVVYEGQGIPPVLSSGNHALIDKARRKDALLLTRAARPDLFVRRRRENGVDKLLVDERVPALDPVVAGADVPPA
ncbi:MAG: tRNA (guanosine(37)-N1)-methyltransferase TrmD [Deltaproteobacteria bacterium]|nr:tRNA (guanosine(37)-N1)-methyltransferase TrmD [Deltaproteobacteria bacterium]